MIVTLAKMDIQIKQDSVVVSHIANIVASNSREFKERVLSVLTDSHRVVELDLTDTSMVDSSGLGSLISLDKTMRARKGLVRLLNPSRSVMTILELTRLHRVFEVINCRLEAKTAREKCSG
jgi:anti-sigma B factor antagonist